MLNLKEITKEGNFFNFDFIMLKVLEHKEPIKEVLYIHCQN